MIALFIYTKLDLTCLLVQLEPRLVVLGVGVLQAEEPDLPQPDGLHNLREDGKGCNMLL